METPKPKERIGITSTIPVEIVYASSCVPVDLNNVFITDPRARVLIEEAERFGLPRNICTWVKGVHSVIRNNNINVIIGVAQGDCSPMISMLESLLPIGVEFIPFSFPYEKNRQLLRWEVQKLMDYFGVQWDDVEASKARLDEIRKLAHEIDRLTWQENRMSSANNLYALVNCTDFLSDPDGFKNELESLVSGRKAEYPSSELRLGLIGIPGVFTNLYDYLEDQGARVVFHEVSRQFAMPEYTKDLLDQNLCYTYPYSFYGRVQDIQEQAQVRRLDGFIHYVQAFCHHQLEDYGFRQQLKLPILTLEGDQVGKLDGRTKTRLETFVQMLRTKQRRAHGTARR